MPGFGDSEIIPLAVTRDFNALARRFMDALGIARAVGVGTSYGTVILADLARSNPGRIGASRLQHISNLLQVPISFFFDGAPHQPGFSDMGEAPSPGYVADFLSTSDGQSLTKAFIRIKDSKLRRRIVELVENIAENR
jgi:pimeloyl-ACP methyl ester carboxylesterase